MKTIMGAIGMKKKFSCVQTAGARIIFKLSQKLRNTILNITWALEILILHIAREALKNVTLKLQPQPQLQP